QAHVDAESGLDGGVDLGLTRAGRAAAAEHVRGEFGEPIELVDVWVLHGEPGRQGRTFEDSCKNSPRSGSGCAVDAPTFDLWPATTDHCAMRQHPPPDDIPDALAPPPSRSQRRREALDVLKLAQALAAMSDAELAPLPLDDELRAEVRRTRAVTQPIARKRQTQYLAKQLRKLDDDARQAIRAALDHDRALRHR